VTVCRLASPLQKPKNGVTFWRPLHAQTTAYHEKNGATFWRPLHKNRKRRNFLASPSQKPKTAQLFGVPFTKTENGVPREKRRNFLASPSQKPKTAYHEKNGATFHPK
jgi:hypothetical protein